VYHKGGSVGASRTVGAIIVTADGPVALAVLTDENKDRRWTDDNAGDLLCSRISKAVYEYYQHKSPAKAEDDVTLSLGAQGRQVEILQRTLNARLKPSLDVAVDGEFGPETERAVRALQQQSKLEPTGRV